jgi:hypothetical protein
MVVSVRVSETWHGCPAFVSGINAAQRGWPGEPRLCAGALARKSQCDVRERVARAGFRRTRGGQPGDLSSIGVAKPRQRTLNRRSRCEADPVLEIDVPLVIWPAA